MNGVLRFATAEELAEQLGEQLRLATEIADEAARSDIERCGREHSVDGHFWWFANLPGGSDAYDLMTVARALRYLALRGRIERHPDQPHLVRFTAT